MSTALWVLTSAVLLLVLVTVLSLITPVRIAFAVRTSPTWQLEVAARLLGGLMPAISFRSARSRRVDERRPGQEKKPGPTKHKMKGASRSSPDRVLRAISGTPQLLTGLLRPIQLDHLSVDADVGLADPADTGQLFGMIAAAKYAMPVARNMSILVRPDFSGPRASGQLDGALSFVPLALIAPGVRFAWRVYGTR